MENQHTDKVAADPLTAWMDASNQEPLRLAGETEVAVSLRRLLNAQESMGAGFDSERLMRAAWTLDQAGKWSGPAVAITWLNERPGHARLGLVLCLLVVSWNCGPGMPPPDPALVESLLSVYDNLPYDVISENSLLIVLVIASRSGLPTQLAARVRNIIGQARQVPGRQPEVQAELDAFLNTPPG